MAEKYKKRLSRRAQERLDHAVRVFDLTMLGIVLVSLICLVICFFLGTDLRGASPAGFAYWFLVVVACPPMLLVNTVRAVFGLPIPAPGAHGELFLQSATAIVWVVVLWAVFRILGKRDTKSQVLLVSTRLAQIMLCWGLFQLCCVVLAINFSSGARAAMHAGQSAKPQDK